MCRKNVPKLPRPSEIPRRALTALPTLSSNLDESLTADIVDDTTSDGSKSSPRLPNGPHDDNGDRRERPDAVSSSEGQRTVTCESTGRERTNKLMTTHAVKPPLGKTLGIAAMAGTRMHKMKKEMPVVQQAKRKSF